MKKLYVPIKIKKRKTDFNPDNIISSIFLMPKYMLSK